MSIAPSPGTIYAVDPWAVTSFYAFEDLPSPADWKPTLLEKGKELAIVGTVLLATEGINGTIAGPTREAVNEFLEPIKAQFPHLITNETAAPDRPFQKWLVKVKKEIIALRNDAGSPLQQTAKHVSPQEWNDLLSHPDVLLIDTRNTYEVEAGTFANAVDPKLNSFGEFPDFVENLKGQEDKPVAMFCTGGIRCEKAGAYMLAHGFKEVYQLRGGILTYLRETPQDESKFHGECFVFDERRAIK